MLSTINNLGILYAYQGKVTEAEEMYMWALQGKEKAWGAEHISTISTVNNLGILYAHQGKIMEAEEMYMRALRGYEQLPWVPHSRIDAVRQSLLSLHERSYTSKDGHMVRRQSLSDNAQSAKMLEIPLLKETTRQHNSFGRLVHGLWKRSSLVRGLIK